MKQSLHTLAATLILVGGIHTVYAMNDAATANSFKNVVKSSQNIIDALNYDIALYASLKNDARDIAAEIQDQTVQFNDISNIVETGINNMKSENILLRHEVTSLSNLVDFLNSQIDRLSSAFSSLNDLSQSEIDELLATLYSIETTYDVLVAERDQFLAAYNEVDENLNAYIEQANDRIRVFAFLAGEYEAVQAYDQSVHDHNISSIDLPL